MSKVLLRVTSLLLLISVFVIALSTCAKQETPAQDEIESRIREILSLPTFEHVYRDIVYVGEEARFLGILTKDKRVLFSIDVTVQGGIDLTEGLDFKLLDDESAVVSMPPATILSIDADENTINQYFARELGGGVSTLQYYDEINRKKEFLKGDAISRGLLVKAEANAVRLIRNFLELMGYTEIEFKELRPVRNNETDIDSPDEGMDGENG